MSDYIYYPYDSSTIWKFAENPDGILSDWSHYYYDLKRCFSFENDCFDSYWENYEQNLNFYFFFPIMPIWTSKVVDEFNSKFKNLKIIILANREIKFSLVKDGFNNSRLLLNEEGDITLSCPVFTIEMSDEYKPNVVRYLRYFIHHFLQMLNFTRQYINLNAKCTKNYIDYVINLNNKMVDKGLTYQSLSEVKINIDKFYLMDDINGLNLRFGDNDSVIKQTEIYYIIADENRCPFKIGDKVIYSYYRSKVYTVIRTYRYIPYFQIEDENGITSTYNYEEYQKV